MNEQERSNIMMGTVTIRQTTQDDYESPEKIGNIGFGNDPMQKQVSLASIAVSLKRIADLLEQAKADYDKEQGDQ